MTTLYLREQGASAGTRDGRIIVAKSERMLLDTPLLQVEQIVVFGNVHLTTPLIAHCLRQGVDVCYLSARGEFRGRLCCGPTKDALLRLRQFQQCASPPFALAASQQIVAGKIHNQLVYLRRHEETQAEGKRLITPLRRLRARSLAARDLEELRGVEGAAAARYFEVFGQGLPVGLDYSGRRERPARDPVNALLNLVYTLLYNNLLSTLHMVGLDPYQGCLHQSRHGHAALASDLMEEFRPVVADSLATLMFRHGELREADFQRSEAGDVRFMPGALKRILERYDARLNTRAMYTPRKAQLTYSQIIEQQVRLFARVVRGEEASYHAYHWDW